ncbi:hypothetical protein ACVWZA_000527 [Sphingomonas sp. UYAg733]
MQDDDEREEAAERGEVASTWPRARYGDVEDLLVELTEGDPRSVAGRFKKLRLLSFPDAVKLGTGNRVEYDLPRVLALCTAFEVNALLVPQSNAVSIVQSVWPEIVRGMIAGAAELGVLPRPKHMPAGISAVVAILPDGFASEGQLQATAANVPIETLRNGGSGLVAELRLNCARLVELVVPRLQRSRDGAAGASVAFGDLDLGFGWDAGRIPHRASVSDLFSGTSFLDRGPYLERAAAFLKIAKALPRINEQAPEDAEASQIRPRSRQAAQNLLDYLGRPSPIDAWKGEIGTTDGRPRLKHYLAAVGDAVGLTPPTQWPGTMLGTTGASPSARAKALVRKALRVEAEKRAGNKKDGAS